MVTLKLMKVLGTYMDLVNDLRVRRGARRLVGADVATYSVKLLLPPLAVHLVLYTLLGRYLPELPLAILALPIPLYLALPILAEVVLGHSYSKNLEEELKYFAIVQGLSPGEDLLRDVEDCCVFMGTSLRSLCNEYARISILARFLPGMSGLREYLRRAPRPMRRLLSEYVAIRESAGYSTWISAKFQEALYELRTSIRRFLELKTTLTLIAVVFAGLTPPLLSLLYVVGGTPPYSVYTAFLSVAALSLVAESSSPKILRVSTGSRKLRLASVTVYCLPLVLVLLLPLPVALLVSGVAMVALGALQTYSFLHVYLGVLAQPSKLVIAASKLPYSSKPGELVEELVGGLHEFNLFAALCRYFLLKSSRTGDVNTVKILAFKEVVEDLFSLVKQATLVKGLVVATALALPVITRLSLALAYGSVPILREMYVYTTVASVAYGILASYTVFGNCENTLITGTVLLELYFLGAAP
jgi:hypothetical protein